VAQVCLMSCTVMRRTTALAQRVSKRRFKFRGSNGVPARVVNTSRFGPRRHPPQPSRRPGPSRGCAMPSHRCPAAARWPPRPRSWFPGGEAGHPPAGAASGPWLAGGLSHRRDQDLPSVV
jgi:hypothetical protein